MGSNSQDSGMVLMDLKTRRLPNKPKKIDKHRENEILKAE